LHPVAAALDRFGSAAQGATPPSLPRTYSALCA